MHVAYSTSSEKTSIPAVRASRASGAVRKMPGSTVGENAARLVALSENPLIDSATAELDFANVGDLAPAGRIEIGPKNSESYLGLHPSEQKGCGR